MVAQGDWCNLGRGALPIRPSDDMTDGYPYPDPPRRSAAWRLQAHNERINMTYETPKLTELGSLTDLTLGNGSGGSGGSVLKKP